MLKTAQSQLTPITLELFSDKTRDLLLESSLVLFNERGFSNVTTASIADTSGILEGSLWYHFNTKKELLSAHIRLLEEVFFDKNQTVDSKEFDIILKDIFTSYNLIWDFRYILRDNFQIPQEKIENLSEVILVLGRYWLDYSEKKYPDSDNMSLRSKGLEHIFMVLSPHISPEALPLITDMLADY